MIQANELRIGSWVKFEDRPFQIHVISEELPCLNTDEFGIGVVSWNNLESIYLTPEILEKCGFENERMEIGCLTLIESGDSYNIGIELRFGQFYYDTSIKVKHLHQLQNIYFALTGEELNYTP